MVDIFISYKSERRNAAEHLAEVLADYGYTVWWDYGLVSGSDFGPQIEAQLRAAKAVIVLWCERAKASQWVRSEATLAKRLKTFVPARIENCELPLDFLLDQTLDLAKWDGAPQSHTLQPLLFELSRLIKPPTPNLEGLARTERAWRRFGAPPLAQFALIDPVETRVGERAFAGALEAVGPGQPAAPFAPAQAVRDAAGPATTPSALAWAQIAQSLDQDDYAAFIRHFPGAAELMMAERQSRQLFAWQKTDRSDPEAIAAFLKEPSFPALEAAAQAQIQAAKSALDDRLEREKQQKHAQFQAELEANRQKKAVIDEHQARLGLAAAKALAAVQLNRPVSERAFPLELPGVSLWPTPQMIAIPPGRFLMGAAQGEEGASADEFPQHEVRIDYAFALGQHAVTFAEWDAALAAGAKLEKPGDAGWGRGNRPVINVNWEEAQAYLAWLNEKAGLAGRPDAYRLPSEAEWEYACRAKTQIDGTNTPFSFGATISTDRANYDGNSTYGGGKKGEYRQKTMPVGSFPANAFGLHEMHGNVWEWVEDCYADYGQTPEDGTPNTTIGCSYRVIRGGSWNFNPAILRSAYRSWYSPSDRCSNLGFRVARTL